jgi:quercetin dioxygenase-like cupin family protein
MTKDAKTPAVLHYDEIAWDRPLETGDPGTRPPRALVEQAQKTGARRKKIVRGEGGFHMNRSVLPAGFRVPPHKHNHGEMLVVLRGGCEFDDGLATLSADDTIVIEANTRYGFTCGPEGMEFLTIRTGESSTSLTG